MNCTSSPKISGAGTCYISHCRTTHLLFKISKHPSGISWTNDTLIDASLDINLLQYIDVQTNILQKY